MNSLELTKLLLERASVSPDDAGCQLIVETFLKKLHFQTEFFTWNHTTNLLATRHIVNKPVLLFLGHTDVVPAGDEKAWLSPPFIPTLRDGKWYARGIADMKGSIACMMIAIERFFSEIKDPSFGISVALTSDEESTGADGIQRLVPHLQKNHPPIDWCLVGEPSCAETLGDTIRVGRRGSMYITLQTEATQMHSAYAGSNDNALHHLVCALRQIIQHEWEKPTPPFPELSCHITQLKADAGALNVIPHQATAILNVRFGPEQTPEKIVAVCEHYLKKTGISYTCIPRVTGLPFLSEAGALRKTTDTAIQRITGLTPRHTTCGGTSDGRFIAPLGTEVLEFGHINQSIHQVNEWVYEKDIETLTNIYFEILLSLQRK